MSHFDTFYYTALMLHDDPIEGCSVEGSVRLVGGQVDREGTVQVCQGGVWGLSM